MIVPYADAAALMLANVDRANTMSRRRAGTAGRDARIDAGDGEQESERRLTRPPR